MGVLKSLRPGALADVVVQVTFEAVCKIEGAFRLQGISYVLDSSLSCFDDLARRGQRLVHTREQRLEPAYAPDTSLDIAICPPGPRLAIHLDELPKTMLHGETRSATLRVANSGQVGLRHLRMNCSDPSFLCLSRSQVEVEANGALP